jgi:hypothetical protein
MLFVERKHKGTAKDVKRKYAESASRLKLEKDQQEKEKKRERAGRYPRHYSPHEFLANPSLSSHVVVTATAAA